MYMYVMLVGPPPLCPNQATANAGLWLDDDFILWNQTFMDAIFFTIFEIYFGGFVLTVHYLHQLHVCNVGVGWSRSPSPLPQSGQR